MPAENSMDNLII